jgi:hypothetical protein
MAATYDTARSRAIDRVRSRVRDTGTYDPDVEGVQPVSGAISSDEEILSLIARHGETEATALVAEELAMFFALEPKSVSQQNGVTFSYGDRSKNLIDLAASIRARSTAVPASSNSTPSGTFSVPHDVQY